MSDDIKEIYAEEGKELTSLIQEWVNENIEVIIGKCRGRDTYKKINS